MSARHNERLPRWTTKSEPLLPGRRRLVDHNVVSTPTAGRTHHLGTASTSDASPGLRIAGGVGQTVLLHGVPTPVIRIQSPPQPAVAVAHGGTDGGLIHVCHSPIVTRRTFFRMTVMAMLAAATGVPAMVSEFTPGKCWP